MKRTVCKGQLYEILAEEAGFWNQRCALAWRGAWWGALLVAAIGLAIVMSELMSAALYL